MNDVTSSIIDALEPSSSTTGRTDERTTGRPTDDDRRTRDGETGDDALPTDGAVVERDARSVATDRDAARVRIDRRLARGTPRVVITIGIARVSGDARDDDRDDDDDDARGRVTRRGRGRGRREVTTALTRRRVRTRGGGRRVRVHDGNIARGTFVERVENLNLHRRDRFWMD